MWHNLPTNQKDEYKRLILAFSSLTEMFIQKSIDDNILPMPIINSKFQETIFQKVFKATAEDIGNTSYDVSLVLDNNKKYLIGIKTFGFDAQDQKIAQFKANNNEWSNLVNEIKSSAENIKDKNEILKLNNDRYLELAEKISQIRNERISSSQANLRGFDINQNDIVEAIYHILMPHIKDNKPKIYVAETDYTPIDINKIKIIGCTSANKPENFIFTDEKHIYKYTPADSQLYMKFDNKNIIKEKWQVIYAQNAYDIFKKIGEEVYNSNFIVDTAPKIIQSFSWKIELQLQSGFNSFYGIGLKKKDRASRTASINKLKKDFDSIIDSNILKEVISKLELLVNNAENEIIIRSEILKLANLVKNNDFTDRLQSLLFRPINEIYIPIPHAKKFHEQNTDFFGKGIGVLNDDGKLELQKEQRCFNLVFDPSGTKIKAFITQDFGKAIQSYEKQSELGRWILREIFRLKEYEPLTQKRLNEIGINGIRLYKLNNDESVYFQFIYIDESNLPKDYIK